MKLKYTVLGAGAMGLRYGILLQEAGFDVDFVDTWKPEVETIRKQNGVYVSRDGQNRHLVPVNIYYPEEYKGDTDVYIAFMKQMQLPDMLKRSAHFFKKDQYMVSGMNGMGHIEQFDQHFEKQHVIGGTALIGTVLNHPGDVDFIGKKGAGSMHMANQTEKPDDETHQIVADFQKSNLNPTLTTNFMGTLLSKVIFNSVVNSLCTMMKIPMGEFIQAPTAKQLSKQLINEAYDVCERAGIKLLSSREEEWQTIHYVSQTSNPLHYPSMYQDFSRGRPTEVDYINGYLYDLGVKYHYEATAQNFLRNMVHLAEFTGNFDLDKYVKSIQDQEK
ncbi:2-dehydropantoate 2-reductase [Philodulcilactobacillus myokoensis]|uniref:2-dehydropantoate 2-reductase n=1 Tax=Philodulcilactobacillus myokoensis TaxID=2929573 RepID=A0A9W6AZJ2_9LACO|nr:ketopantoate reductase family protein [Philodulcilactobacillus myokoensis]GLB46300.1 2-dehydropantoate 2-reductase [Philodulcilactobacillus myokoensis]